MKPYQIALVLALAGAAGLVLFGDRTPSSGVAEAVVRGGAAGSASASASTPAPAPRARADKNDRPVADVMIARLLPREELIGAAGEATFAGGEGVFLGQNWNPPPPKISAAAAAAAAAPPAPMAPPMPFTFIGKAASDGAWEVFLARGDKTYVVRAKMVIDGAYRVDSIAPPFMSLTYLPLNQVQQLNIGVLD